jgi:sugar/nucleoside kinase (ribokinase family)
LNNDGTFTAVASVKLPKGYIKGSVGAGDAFCAGSLYSIYNGFSDQETLSFSNLVAVSCLSAPDSVSGIKSAEELKELVF